MAADINGYDPFPSLLRFPGADFFPGPASEQKTTDYKNSVGITSFIKREDFKPGTSMRSR